MCCLGCRSADRVRKKIGQTVLLAEIFAYSLQVIHLWFTVLLVETFAYSLLITHLWFRVSLCVAWGAVLQAGHRRETDYIVPNRS